MTTPPSDGEQRPAELTVSPVAAQLFSLLLLPLTLALFLAIFLMHGLRVDLSLTSTGWIGLVLFLVLGTIVHELIHGLAWHLAGGIPWAEIRFGFHRRWLAPYAHTSQPMSARAYRIGVLLPGLLTGILPGIIGVLLGNIWLTLGAATLFSGAGGDLLVWWAIRSVRAQTSVRDHPERIGCLVFDESGPQV